MNKRIISVLICIALIVCLSLGAFAASGVIAELSSNRFYIDGDEAKLEAYAINGSNYVKLRDIAKSVGFSVGYDAESGNVSIDSQAPYTADSDGVVEIYLIRHGKTIFNTTGLMQGWSDTPLTDEGVDGALKAAAGLADVQFSTAYSSDLGRARSTAGYILAGNNSPYVPRLVELIGLREQGYGIFEGLPEAEVRGPLLEHFGLKYDDKGSFWPEFYAVSTEQERVDVLAAMDETGMAETYEEIITRTESAIETIVEQTLAAGGGKALVVSHGGEILNILTHYAPEFKGGNLKNCSLSILRYENGEFTLELVGDTTYMD